MTSRPLTPAPPRTAPRALPLPAAVPGSVVARRVPRPQTLPVPAGDQPQQAGPNDLGTIRIADEVVARIAARAALEVAGVGSAPSGVLGLTGRSAQAGALPTAHATVDGHLALVELSMSVRYPLAVREVAAAVRSAVRERVGELAGLQVPQVDITVPALADGPAPGRRVR